MGALHFLTVHGKPLNEAVPLLGKKEIVCHKKNKKFSFVRLLHGLFQGLEEPLSWSEALKVVVGLRQTLLEGEVFRTEWRLVGKDGLLNHVCYRFHWGTKRANIACFLSPIISRVNLRLRLEQLETIGVLLKPTRICFRVNQLVEEPLSVSHNGLQTDGFVLQGGLSTVRACGGIHINDDKR